MPLNPSRSQDHRSPAYLVVQGLDGCFATASLAPTPPSLATAVPCAMAARTRVRTPPRRVRPLGRHFFRQPRTMPLLCSTLVLPLRRHRGHAMRAPPRTRSLALWPSLDLGLCPSSPPCSRPRVALIHAKPPLGLDLGCFSPRLAELATLVPSSPPCRCSTLARPRHPEPCCHR